MGLVEFEKRGGTEVALVVRGDKIIFTKNWPIEAIKAMRKAGMKDSDEDWAKLYKILSLMYKDLNEGDNLVSIAYDKKFSIEGKRIEAVRGHFEALIDELALRKELFAQVGCSEIYRQLESLLIMLRKESSEY